MLTTVLFDLDDTILDFHRCEAAALTNALTAAGITVTPQVIALYSAINDAHWKALERGEITRAQVLTGRFQRLFQELGVSACVEMVQSQYEDQLSRQHFFLPGARELLDTLKGRYELDLISNGTAVVQDRRLAESGLLPCFRHIFISQRLGYDKPSPAFFDACFAAMPGKSRAECVIVGDSLTSDILGGINAGIRTVWYNPKHMPPNPDIPADYEIHSLGELPERLETL